MDFILLMSAILLFYAATDVGRGKESKIIFMSRNWWLRLALVTIGGGILVFYVEL